MANLSSFYPQPVIAGTTDGTFAEGDDARIVGAIQSGGAAGGGLSGTYPNPTLAAVTASGSTTARILSDRFADAVNVKDFGAVGDAVKLSNCSITSGANVLNCSTANFTTDDIGKSIAVGSADATGHTIFTTITGRNSATQITIGVNASTTVTASDVTYGTEDGPAIRAAVAYARTVNKAVYMPRGQYLMNTALSNSSGNPQISSIPVGGYGFGIFLQNTNGNIPQSFYMFGDGASIVSSLYPPSSNSSGTFEFINITGFFDQLHFEGITFDSYRQLVNSTSGAGAAGKVYGFRFQGVGGVSGFWSQNNRPFNTRIINCTFYDQTLSIRADSAENLSVSGCNFLYRRGQAGVGNGDWTGAVGFRQVRSLRVIDNYMNGCLADDMDSIVTNFEDKRCVDNFVISGNNGGEHALQTCLISNNVITRFAFEAILILGPNGNPIDDFEDGVQIVGNWIDGRLPQNHKTRFNWGIVLTGANATIVGNNIFQASVAISLGKYSIYTSTPKNILIKSNNIILSEYSRSGYAGSSGISFSDSDNIIIQGNQIIGKNIGSYRQNGWDGSGTRPTATIASSSVVNNTITVTGNVWPNGSTVVFSSLPAGSGLTAGTPYYVIDRAGDTFKVSTSEGGSAIDITADVAGATITADRLDITIGIKCVGSSSSPPYNAAPPIATCYIKNNNLKIESKNSSGFLCSALALDSGNGQFFVSDNIVDGFDFIVHREGGDNLSIILDRNRITRNIRMPSGYINALYGAPLIKDHIFRIYPTQIGWYQIPIYTGMRYGSSFDLTITTYGEYRYGDTTTLSQIGTQVTKLNFISYTDEGGGSGSTNSRLVLNQTHAGPFPAVTEAYVRSSSGGFLFYLNVNKVLSKIALTFSGGGTNPTHAEGYANVVNGVITSVTVTSVGSDYTSAPTVSINAPIRFGISGSGATFTAVLSGNTVGSVTVGGSGGSGYAQPLDFHVVCDDLENEGIALDYPKYHGSTPSSGMKMVFSTGTKNMVLSGGSGGTIMGSGDPIVATQAPTESPAVTPEFIGQQYINTASGIAYIATGTSSSSDWKALATWNP